MKTTILAIISILAITGCASTTPTRITENAYMVIDVKGTSEIRNEVVDTVIETVQENMSDLTLNRGIPPSVIPEKASRFELVDPFSNTGLGAMVQAAGGSTKMPTCKDPILTMQSKNNQREWGERTTFFICVVQYSDGFHVDIYTTFEQQSGGVSINALSASLARSVVGDTSQLIPRTMNRIHNALLAVSEKTSVVDSYIPKDWESSFLSVPRT